MLLGIVLLPASFLLPAQSIGAAQSVRSSRVVQPSLVHRGGAGVGLPSVDSALVLRGGTGGLAAVGAAYSSALAAAPIVTKSITAGAIFAMSDQAAQSIEGGERDVKRTLTSALVGLFYFGPALHFWLEMITRVVPGFGITDTLKKTLLGQCFFGPTITCIFFGASLISTLGLMRGLGQWPKKIKQDLLVTWASGLGFWPFVDLIVYSFVPVQWIPLGYNLASFVWTIFLSIQASRTVSKA